MILMVMVIKMTKKTDKYYGFLVKIYPFQALLLGKKRTKTTRQGSTPIPPLNGQCPFKAIIFFMDAVPKLMKFSKKLETENICSVFSSIFPISRYSKSAIFL